MILRTLVTAVSLLFVAASLAVLVVDLVRQKDGHASTTSAGNSSPASPKIIVYSFHTTERCEACLTIEDTARQTLLTYFADQLDSGEIEWEVLDYQAPSNAHFARDFKLVTSMVVLADASASPPTRWKSLNGVWTYANNRETLMDYLHREVDDFLKREAVEDGESRIEDRGGKIEDIGLKMEDRDSNSRSAILHPSSSILHPPFSILSGRDLVLAGLTAFWLGLLTVLSPCPLAMNVTAIAYIGRRVGDARGVLVSGVLYAVGRSVAYVVLAALLVWGLLSAPGVSGLLRTVMPRCLDLLLIVTGMVLLGLVSLGTWNTNTGARLGERISRWNYLGAGLLGAVSALTFCPVSAALFFLSLIPLAGTFESPVFIPLLYGIGGSLPMLALAVILSFGTRSVARAFHRLTQVDWWARRLTGVVFLLLGLSLTLHNIFGVNLG